MGNPAPELYRKPGDQVISGIESELKSLDIGYEGQEGGAGRAFVRLFGRLSDLAVQRLNQVPDKHFFAFLNAAGIDHVPPGAALTELSFTLADDAPASVLVPEKSQMATAKTETAPEIVFETLKDITITKNSLSHAVTMDPVCFSTRTDEALGVKNASWPAFSGTLERSRVLYIGDRTLFSFEDETQRAGAVITLTVDFEKPGQPATDGWALSWSYFDGKGWAAFPKESVRDTTNHFSRNGTVEFRDFPLIAETVLDGQASLFMACTLSGGSGRNHLPVIRSVTGSRSVSIASVQVTPASVLSAIQSGTTCIPLDPSGEFFPMGQKPSRLDAFYLNADEVFGRPGGTCDLSMTVDHAPNPVAELGTGPRAKTLDAVISWEYYGKSGWTTLATTTDTTEMFKAAGPRVLRFMVPRMEKTTVNDREGYWLRARLSMGSYEIPGHLNNETPRSWEPPMLFAPLISHLTMTLSYTQSAGPGRVVSHIIGSTDHDVCDHWNQMASGKVISPFQCNEEGPACYLGFPSAFPAGEWIQILVDVDENAREEEYRTPVRFEYYNGRSFIPLRISDGTLGLKTRGYLGFFAPDDHAQAVFFAKGAYWIRLLPQDAGEAGPYLKNIRTNTVPAVNALSMNDVVLGSSDGKADQTFVLARTPLMTNIVLAVLEPDRPGADELENHEQEIEKSENPGPVFPCPSEKWLRWILVPDFYSSTGTSRHFTLDPMSGVVRFGDGQRGAIPPIGSNNIRLVSVTYHEGLKGNVAAGAVTVVRNPAGDLAFIKRVINHESGSGGSDVESLEDIRQRGPQRLKHRQRAVTLEDYEWVAREATSEVKHARCFPVTDALGKMKAGHVTVVIIPESAAKKPSPGPALIRTVRTFLEKHSLLNLMRDKDIHVKGPSYVECSVKAVVTPLFPEKSDQVELAILSRLEGFLHPLKGGPSGSGWTLGRDVFLSEISAEIEQVEGVDHLNVLSLSGSLQQFHLAFEKEKNRFRKAPFDMEQNSRVATFDETIRCLLADPVSSGSSLESMIVYGFKTGDKVAVVTETQGLILENLSIGHVTARHFDSADGDAVTWEIGFETPFDPPSDWADRAALVSADGRLRMPVTGDDQLDSSGRVAALVVSGFKKGDRVSVVQGNIREPLLEFIPVAAVRHSTHRVFVPADCLIYSGTHDVDMKIGD